MLFDNLLTKKPVGVLSVAIMLVLTGCVSQPTTTKPTNNDPKIAIKNGVPSHYQVKAGDTVVKIAKRYDLNWREVSAMNRLDSNHTIYIGQWLVLWQKQSIGKADFGNKSVAQKPILAPAPTLKQSVKTSVGQVQTQRAFPVAPPKPAPSPKPAQSEPKPAPNDPKVIKADTAQKTIAAPVAQKPAPAPTPILAPAPQKRDDDLPLLTPMGNTPLVGASAVRHFRYPVGTHNKVVRQFGSLVNGVKSEGMFFAGHEGDVVVASQAGTVVYADDNGKGDKPKAVMVEHSDGYISTYIHLKDIAVKKGQSVPVGATIGSMQVQAGSLALFEFRMAKDGRYIDPVSVLK